jgi:hypothetical protein
MGNGANCAPILGRVLKPPNEEKKFTPQRYEDDGGGLMLNQRF